MAWRYRDVPLPVFVSGAAMIASCVIASCSSSPPPAANCTFKQDQNGNLVCVEDQSSQGGASGNGVSGPTSTSGMGVTGIPMVDGSSTTGTGGIPMVDGGSTSSTTTGGTPGGVGGSSTATTDGAQGPTATDGQGPATTTTASSTTGGTAGNRLGTLRVSAGEFARDHTIVSFLYPEGLGKAMSLTDSQGAEIPLQYSSATGKASFILSALAAGETADYTINELAQALPAGVTATVEPDTTGDQLFLRQGDSKVFRWTLVEDNFRGAQARDVRAGYIFPVYTPGGLNVADDYQVDHPHMHGIWSAWTLTTFRGHKVDFWNGYDNTGRVDLVAMEGIWNGPVTGGLIANLVHSDITTTPRTAALNEKWIVTVYRTHDSGAPYYVFDVDSTQATAGQDPLVLETYHYGGFGYRGSEQWQDPSKVQFLTSEGHNRSNGDGQRARWVAQFGTVDGQVGGYAAFDHPTNFRHPQGLRIHPTNPYWSFTACTQSAGGRFTIESGSPYKSLYRIVAFDGAADAALLNRLWNDFGSPPSVEILP